MPPVRRDGFYIVSFPLTMRLVFALFAVGIGGLFLYVGITARPSPVFWILAAIMGCLLGLGFPWLFRTEIIYDHNHFTVASMWSVPRQFSFSEVRREVGLGVNGYRFEMQPRHLIHVSPFQRGHREFLKRLRERIGNGT